MAEFPAGVKDSANAIVEAAIEIYGRMSTDLLPTPTKSHYVFNLRDLSKCVQGILRADPGVIREQVRFRYYKVTSYALYFHVIWCSYNFIFIVN